ncbi:MAG: aminotransferase class IV [Chloroflexota bacterium]
MPIMIRQLKPHGLQPVGYTADSLKAAADHEPADGVYTVAITHGENRVLKLTAHLTRLADSAQREGIDFTLPHSEIRAALRQVISMAELDRVKFRITVPRATPNDIIISVEAYHGYPESYFTEGVKVVTAANSARHNPGAKDSQWILDRKAIEDGLAADVHTAVLLDAGGNMLEGTSSNFYAVMNDQLYTAVDGVLPGTSQQIVFETAPDVLPLVKTPVNIRDVGNIQEAFITSSSRWVMPVVQIDAVVMGNGMPGPHTLQLREVFLRWVDEHSEAV